MDLGLTGKTAIVMASSQGLGKAVAEEFVREGANVMIASRDHDKLARVQAELEEIGAGQVAFHVCDVLKKEDIRSLVEAVHDQFGKVDILINNAGGPPAGTFEDFDDEHWQNAFELNLLSNIRLIREVLPDLKEKGGHIVNLTSTSVKQPIQGLILSNTIRTGVVGLAKSLSVELAPYNILVNTVGPGSIQTERLEQITKATAEKNGWNVDDFIKKEEANIPLGRFGTPSEFAKTVVFLASGANTYITGSTLFVDGGKVTSI
jgi:3-oxoacyl-[acyl-carrier protein] reductase